MYLRSIRIENFRGIREGFVTFAETTVLIGENDCGRSSIIEALLLLLGAPEETFEARLRPVHFHRTPEDTSGPLRIQLHIAEDAVGAWILPDCLKRAFRFQAGSLREFELEFRAVLDLSRQAIRKSFTIRSPKAAGSIPDNNADALNWIRELVPVLWLRSGLFDSSARLHANGSLPAVVAGDPDLCALEQHYRNILTGDATDLVAELDAGAKAAQRVLKKKERIFASAGPSMSAMVSDILNRRPLSAIDTEHQGSTSSHKIGALLILGAMLQLVQRKLSPQGKPVLLVENPESNLHPMTLSVAWRIIERLVWQKIIATNSDTILTGSPLASIRRLTKNQGHVQEWSVAPRTLSRDALRRVSYHLRSKRASAMFARCWLLVEGETEYWILRELARLCGFDFDAEGVACVEFAQCGLPPLTRLADHLGIGWHVLVDGDEAGQHYAQALTASRRKFNLAGQLTRIPERDIEHCFWHNGFADILQRLAYPATPMPQGASASAVIRKAIDKSSKPFVALRLIEAVGERGAQSIPRVIRMAIESSIQLARSAAMQ